MGKNQPTIVLVDDTVGVRALVRAHLSISGLISVVAEGADGREAIGLAFQHKPSLLLLDMSMPGMDGLEALPGILTVSPRTLVVIFSGFEERGLAKRARELGASAFIEKSIPIDELESELLRILSANAPAAQLVEDVVAGNGQTILDEQIERFREVFDEAAIGMGTMTLNGTLVRANRALANLMSYEQHDLIGLDYGRLTAGGGDHLDATLRDINENAVDLAQIEHEVIGAPEPRTVLATLAPVRDTRGKALYVFLQVQDITAQRETEEALRRSEEKFRLLVEAVGDYAIFMLDPGGNVVSWNTGAQRSKGYSSQEIIGRHFRTFYPLEKQAERHPEHELDIALRDGRYEEEGWRIRKDGTKFWASVIITAVYNEEGVHVGFAKVTKDKTDVRDKEQL